MNRYLLAASTLSAALGLALVLQAPVSAADAPMAKADASAGTIKSGGKTRRAAKMVILNADHPDVEEFIWCKALEEKKARARALAGVGGSHSGSK